MLLFRGVFSSAECFPDIPPIETYTKETKVGKLWQSFLQNQGTAAATSSRPRCSEFLDIAGHVYLSIYIYLSTPPLSLLFCLRSFVFNTDLGANFLPKTVQFANDRGKRVRFSIKFDDEGPRLIVTLLPSVLHLKLITVCMEDFESLAEGPRSKLNWKTVKPTGRMGAVRITSLNPKFNGSHFGLPPSSIHRMTGWVAISRIL